MNWTPITSVFDVVPGAVPDIAQLFINAIPIFAVLIFVYFGFGFLGGVVQKFFGW